MTSQAKIGIMGSTDGQILWFNLHGFGRNLCLDTILPPAIEHMAPGEPLPAGTSRLLTPLGQSIITGILQITEPAVTSITTRPLHLDVKVREVEHWQNIFPSIIVLLRKHLGTAQVAFSPTRSMPKAPNWLLGLIATANS